MLYLIAQSIVFEPSQCLRRFLGVHFWTLTFQSTVFEPSQCLRRFCGAHFWTLIFQSMPINPHFLIFDLLAELQLEFWPSNPHLFIFVYPSIPAFHIQISSLEGSLSYSKIS